MEYQININCNKESIPDRRKFGFSGIIVQLKNNLNYGISPSFGSQSLTL